MMLLWPCGGGWRWARADYVSTVLADNPLGYWRLGEATGPVAYDASPNYFDGAYTGGVTLAEPGALLTDTDTSALFDGATGYVNVGAHSAFNQLSNDFTIEAWHKGEGSGWIVSTRDDCG
jgi:hypothetical protein